MAGIPPSGTVTFMLTDIEGSTRRWQEDPDGMDVALAAHDATLLDVIGAHGGYVFKHTGDGMFAAFEVASDAAAAAQAAQKRLDLPVRIGLHSGAAVFRDSDYYGTTVNYTARLTDAGHGGQILVSAAAASLLEGARLVDLGSHKLKDVNRLTRVWQLGEGSFPPLRVSAAAGNLPARPPELFGREDDVNAICTRLGGSRLVSIVGVGGIGKTSVALAVGDRARDDYSDGVWLVELAPIGDPATLVAAIAGAFGHVQGSGLTLSESLLAALRNKHLLLVLDNCEHLLDSTAEFVESMLEHCPRAVVLTTSREPLGLHAEHQVGLSSLKSNGRGDPAVELFIARARQARSDFRVDEVNEGDIIEICRQLDGIPLAIELAATRARSLAPAELRERLSDRFRLLSAGRRRGLERHQTLHQVVQWSYDLLDEVERVLFCRLGVFAGSWTADAVEVVCAGGPIEALDVFDLLDSLVTKSLVNAQEVRGRTRYRMLETIRQFAAEALAEGLDAESVHQRYYRYYCDETERIIDSLHTDPDGTGLRWLDLEFDNLRATHEAGLDPVSVDVIDSIARRVPDLAFFRLRYEAMAWPAQARAALEKNGLKPSADLVGASVWAPAFAGDLDRAWELSDQMLTLTTAPGATPTQHAFHGSLALALIAGDGARCLQLIDLAGASTSVPAVLTDQLGAYAAWAHQLLGDKESSLRVLDEFEPRVSGRFNAMTTPWFRARYEPAPERALALYDRGRELGERAGNVFWTLAIDREMGALLARAGDARRAVEVLAPVLERWYAAGDAANWASVVCGLTSALSHLGFHSTVALVLGWLEERRSFALTMSNVSEEELEECAARASADIGTASFLETSSSGRTTAEDQLMTHLREVIADALRQASPE
jgi:predicted ATPase